MGMTKRQRRYRKLHNIETRNKPKTKDGARRTDKIGTIKAFRQYSARYA